MGVPGPGRSLVGHVVRADDDSGMQPDAASLSTIARSVRSVRSAWERMWRVGAPWDAVLDNAAVQGAHVHVVRVRLHVVRVAELEGRGGAERAEAEPTPNAFLSAAACSYRYGEARYVREVLALAMMNLEGHASGRATVGAGWDHDQCRG
jgi:hypothetical protein